TSSALEFVQSDLSEFVSTIQHDTSVVIADSATAVNRNIKVEESEKEATTGKLKQGFSNILTSISTNLHQTADKTSKPTQDENKADEQRSKISVMPAVYDRTQARLQEMQTNPETYRNEPDCDAYQRWCETFDLDSKKGEVSELLVNNPDVRRLYTKFVPSVQSHSTFWHRYFYKVHQIETENKRLADIVARASRNDSQDLGWGDEDDEDVTTNTITATPKDRDLSTSPDSNVTIDNQPRHDVLHEDSKSVLDKQNSSESSDEMKQSESTSEKINTKDDCDHLNKNLDSGKRGETEKNIVDDVLSSQNEVSPVGLETKSEGDSSSRKSDSSDSSSWIRVLDKEGTSSNSSSSVVIVNEKDKELDLANDDVDDDDDDFDFNEDISNEDVEKLVQSITANELDSGE
ncbi:Hypothetical predicted protein, partial [Paramuricea clavata]